MKKYLSIILVAMLIALTPMVSAEPSASASRNIENQNLVAGDSTNVTVTIINNVSQALALMENPPSGWILTKIFDDASAFKPSTNEWAWFSVGVGVTKTVIYRLDVPSNAAPGTYHVNGNITNASGIIASVSGEDSIIISGDNILPVIINVALDNTTPTTGQAILVSVNATDNVAVTDVKANGVSLALQGSLWNGTITAIEGTHSVNISASDAAGNVAWDNSTSYTATSTPVLETITVSPPNAALSVGDTQVFTATARDQNGDPMEGIDVAWTSSNMAVGNLSPVNSMTDTNGTATTTFTANANGTAMVNASNGFISGSANVTVSEVVITPVLETITVSPPNATLSVGDTQVFTATALDQNDAPMAGINITWTSSNMAVGNVSPGNAMTGADGKATTTFKANAVGTSIVNATNGSVSGSAEVIVKEEVEEINIIKNPGFESDKKNWIFYTNGTGRFNIVSPGFEGNNASEVQITKGGSNMQLYQKGLTLEPNTRYRLSFAAKSSRGHDVRVVLLKHGSPFTNYGLKQNFNLTKEWQTFTTEFDTKGFTGTVQDGRLMFYLAPFAKAGDKYFFDSVKLVEIE